MPWSPAVFKGEKEVWVEVDHTGAPVLKGGKVSMRYVDAPGAKVYSAFAANVAVAKAEAPVPAAAVAYADGACSGNPGPCGSGALVRLPDGRMVERSLAVGEGTNNIGELRAIGLALDLLTELGVGCTDRIELYTDSKYSIGVLAGGWKAKANQELIAELKMRLRAWPGLRIDWVEGHAGNEWNERADRLAREGVEKSRRPTSIRYSPKHSV